MTTETAPRRNQATLTTGGEKPQDKPKSQTQTSSTFKSIDSKFEITNADPEAAAFNPPPIVECPYCGAKLITKGACIFGRVIWRHDPECCTCEQAQEEKRRQEYEEHAAERAQAERDAAEAKRRRLEKAVKASSMGARFKRRTFETFSVDGDPTTAKGLRYAKTYVAKFKSLTTDPDAREKNGLLFSGSIGTGKTHLASAIANALIAHGEPVLFSTMVDMLDALKETFEKGGGEKLLRLFKTVDLLIIDDLGKERPTEWTASKIYQIVNARYEAMLPIIVTTNYVMDELVERMTPKGGDKLTAAATVDRIREMTYEVALAGDSKRIN